MRIAINADKPTRTAFFLSFVPSILFALFLIVPAIPTGSAGLARESVSDHHPAAQAAIVSETSAAGPNGWRQSVSWPLIREGFGMAYDSESDLIVVYGGHLGLTPSQDTWIYSPGTGNWTKIECSPAPPPLEDLVMAYDSSSDRTILFGGAAASNWTMFSSETWAFDANSMQWAKMHPSVAPSGRMNSAAAYDSTDDKIIVFGGYTLSSFTNETWAYDYDTDGWVNLEPANSPSPRAGARMAYDSGSDLTVMYGGSVKDSGLTNETWAYDYGTNAWTKMRMPGPYATGPTPVVESAMAYDPSSDLVVMQGGGYQGGFHSSEVWTYDVDSDTWYYGLVWSGPGPFVYHSGKSGHCMVYDSALGKMMMYGGFTYWPSSDELWSYEVEPNIWTLLGPKYAPTPREMHAMVYDSGSSKTVLFGGFNNAGTDLNDTWAYDSALDDWTLVETNIAPPARHWPAMAYDAESDITVMFGGYAYFGIDPINWTSIFGPDPDTWVLDLDTKEWTNMNPVTSPMPSVSAAMTYDSSADRVLLLSEGETWAYDFNSDSWQNRTNGAHPPAGAEYSIPHYSMAFDPVSNKTVAFGGRDFSHGNETWIYDYGNNTWRNVTGEGSPPRGGGHAMVAIPQNGTVILFVVNETWEFDVGAEMWTRMTDGPAPPSRSYPAMAYDLGTESVILFGGSGTVGVLHDTWLYATTGGGGAPEIPELTTSAVVVAATAAMIVGLMALRSRRKKTP